MTLQLPTPPHFQKDGTPTTSFRRYIESVMDGDLDQQESKEDLTLLEALISNIDTALNTKQAVKFESYELNDTNSVFVIKHGFNTAKINVNVFKDITDLRALYFIDITATEIKMTFSGVLDAREANLLVKAWGFAQDEY